ncbi:potassium/proton antiporter [Zunongwangia atlantica]|uniref:Sodium/hydrogen exchanger family protein n=1 Tax=Zunongwangia atlantica 22II14-10F7 TaxID=1185767 RepID=A0A1Y1SXU5_9FLAO|nr:potassium/proton antiporter [Zunongwangia atlantica]ORL43568.1 sodium/hydrogen exchanger family protein [Zunongwangia atlantica 22II14-10F7]
MYITIENILFIGSILLFISILVGKTSYKFGVPTLILFLSVGMLAGKEGFGGIEFDNLKIAQFTGIVALNFILFSGGLDTNWKSIRPILGQGVVLSTMGVLLTCILTGTIVWWLTDFNIYEGLLLGAIVSSTDAAAVFSILRSKNLALKNHLRPVLELESGSNDPMAYFLTVALLGLVQNPASSIASIFPIFLQQIILGGLLGLGFGYLCKLIINKIKLDFDGLYPVLAIALMFITFSATDSLGGNGFLAVYLCGVYLGNHKIIHKQTVVNMFDGLAWLMQIVMFLTLGLLVTPSEIIPVVGIGIIISVFLIFIARPLSVFISLSFFKMKMRRRLYISWVGLRGAVPIVFATYPLLAGIEKAQVIFNIVFFVSLSSVLLQGTTLGLVADWLKVSLPEVAKKRSSVEKFLSEDSKSLMREIEVPFNHSITGKQIVELEFPAEAIIAMIIRDGKFITPTGSTIIDGGDTLVVLAEKEAVLTTIASNFEKLT